MTTTRTDARPATPAWVTALLVICALLPGLVAVLPLTMGAAWYLSAEENEPYLSGGRAIQMLISFTIGVAPFFAAAVALVSVRAVGSSWTKAVSVAAVWAFVLGGLAFLAAMLFGGGF